MSWLDKMVFVPNHSLWKLLILWAQEVKEEGLKHWDLAEAHALPPSCPQRSSQLLNSILQQRGSSV